MLTERRDVMIYIHEYATQFVAHPHMNVNLKIVRTIL